MKIIVLSHPSFIEDELDAIHLLFENGLTYFHLRKPETDRYAYCSFLKKIDSAFHKHIIIHDHYELVNEFELKGIHQKSNATILPSLDYKHKSRSCHSFEEIIAFRDSYNYLFLSPIFHSISKNNYQAAFSGFELEEAKEKQIINDKIIALGGIKAESVEQISKWNFGGVAVLGYLWSDYSLTKNTDALLSHFHTLQTSVKRCNL